MDGLTPIECAIYAAAFVDAMREIFAEFPMEERVRRSRFEAEYVVECFRKSTTS